MDISIRYNLVHAFPNLEGFKEGVTNIDTRTSRVWHVGVWVGEGRKARDEGDVGVECGIFFVNMFSSFLNKQHFGVAREKEEIGK